MSVSEAYDAMQRRGEGRSSSACNVQEVDERAWCNKNVRIAKRVNGKMASFFVCTVYVSKTRGSRELCWSDES